MIVANMPRLKFNWEMKYSELCKRTWLADRQQDGFACYILVEGFC